MKIEKVLYSRNYKSDLKLTSLLLDMIPNNLTYNYDLVLIWETGNKDGKIVIRSEDFYNDVPLLKPTLNFVVTQENVTDVMNSFDGVEYNTLHNHIGEILNLLFLKWFVDKV